MRLYDALWALAAADLKASLENRKSSRAVGAALPLKIVVDLRQGTAVATPGSRKFPNPKPWNS